MKQLMTNAMTNVTNDKSGNDRMVSGQITSSNAAIGRIASDFLKSVYGDHFSDKCTYEVAAWFESFLRESQPFTPSGEFMGMECNVGGKYPETGRFPFRMKIDMESEEVEFEFQLNNEEAVIRSGPLDFLNEEILKVKARGLPQLIYLLPCNRS